MSPLIFGLYLVFQLISYASALANGDVCSDCSSLGLMTGTCPDGTCYSNCGCVWDGKLGCVNNVVNKEDVCPEPGETCYDCPGLGLMTGICPDQTTCFSNCGCIFDDNLECVNNIVNREDVCPVTPEQTCTDAGYACIDPWGECGYPPPCAPRDYCTTDPMSQFYLTCAAYPSATCMFYACGACGEYFVDYTGEIVDCDADMCTLPQEMGPCLANFAQYYFNPETGLCQEFVYGGCDANANNFDSLAECQMECGMVKCEQPQVVGPCEALFPRWYYNPLSDECEQFNYGGCRGNDNNFVSESDCIGECVCAETEEYTTCGTACPKTCDTLYEDVMCTMQCVTGCFCKAGYVLDGAKGECIAKRECPNFVETTTTTGTGTTGASECGENEVYNDCGSACPETCSNTDTVSICTRQCVQGCFCADGFVLNGDCECVTRDECSSSDLQKEWQVIAQSCAGERSTTSTTFGGTLKSSAAEIGRVIAVAFCTVMLSVM